MEKRVLKQILLEQREEINRIFQERIIKREIISKTGELFTGNLIKVITGVRRCGKSVLVHLLLKNKNYGYINLDDERLIGTKPGDLNALFETVKEINPALKYIFLDEAQNAAGWELFVNRLKRLGYNIFITGSNSRLLSRELATHLTGRHIAAELFPFSFREFVEYKNKKYKTEDAFIAEKRGEIKNLFAEYVKFGGFPEVIKLKNGRAKEKYLRDLYGQIIVKDVLSRFSIKYVKVLKEMAFYLLSNFSSRMSYNRMKNIFDIRSVHTVKNYVSYLEESCIFNQLNVFSFKVKNQMMQPKKIYVVDTGFINAVASQFSPNYGKIMENIVLTELLRNKDSEEIFFYSDSQGKEVDFVIKKGTKVEKLIQGCFDIEDVNTRNREIRSTIMASQKLKCGNILVLTDDYENEEIVKWQNIERKFKFLPLWKWLLFGPSGGSVK
ncbi:MAG: hypothetical protein COT16_00980 [Elusimicrobia bacterium CG08_land_8_20_14_0_20_44_26]|nr:MAG: hypothetical protein COT16_00980 [Elusimicrobia bacterium CG08_land_8_20_14_0_20_44_26]